MPGEASSRMRRDHGVEERAARAADPPGDDHVQADVAGLGQELEQRHQRVARSTSRPGRSRRPARTAPGPFHQLRLRSCSAVTSGPGSRLAHDGGHLVDQLGRHLRRRAVADAGAGSRSRRAGCAGSRPAMIRASVRLSDARRSSGRSCAGTCSCRTRRRRRAGSAGRRRSRGTPGRGRPRRCRSAMPRAPSARRRQRVVRQLRRQQPHRAAPGAGPAVAHRLDQLGRPRRRGC